MQRADRELEAAASVLAGRALLVRSVEALAPHGIVPVVLKGVLISALAEGSGEPPRRMIDVDLLVPIAQRAPAERALVAAGLVEVARTPAATTLRDHALKLDVDLHSSLIEPGLFRIDEACMISRAKIDRDLFGVAVRVPDPQDLYAHLVAHFARNRSSPRDLRRLRDFAVAARALPMDPDAVAAHLDAHGLGRAARYSLRLAARGGDTFAHDVVAALAPDVLGDALAGGTERWLSTVRGSSMLGVPALHALNATLPAALFSFSLHAARGLRARTRGMLQRARVAR